MDTPIIDRVCAEKIDREWCASLLSERTLISFIQTRVGKKCVEEIDGLLEEDLTEDEYSSLRKKIDLLSHTLDSIDKIFPWTSVSQIIKESYSRAISQSRNSLSLVEQNVNSSEEYSYYQKTSVSNSKRLDQMLTELENKTNSILREIEDNRATQIEIQYEYSNLWIGNFTWLKNLCGYQNRYFDKENYRRDKLLLGVKRIGKYEVITEYLDWLTKVNNDNQLMRNAIIRWEEDRRWLEERNK